MDLVPDVVVGILFGAVNLFNGALEADAEAAALLQLRDLGHQDVVLGPNWSKQYVCIFFLVF